MDRASLITVSILLPIGSSLVMSNPVISNAGWIYRAESNEECTGFRQERMSQCLLRDLIPNKITGPCVEVNTQGSCNNGERSVLAMNDKCLTTKCVKNEDDTKCYGGTLPFKGECYDLNKEIGCDIATQEVDLYAKTHKYRLLVDFFGEGVSCGCNNEYGFVPHNGDCHSDGSLSVCENPHQQLVWWVLIDILWQTDAITKQSKPSITSINLTNSICEFYFVFSGVDRLDPQFVWTTSVRLVSKMLTMRGSRNPNVYSNLSVTGHMMWRRKGCFQNNDKECFKCKPFDEKVKTCNRGLVLRNNTIFCDSGFRLNSVLGTECSLDSTGRCLDVARPPTQIPRSPRENLCRKYPHEDICKSWRGRGRELDIDEDDVTTTTPVELNLSL